MTELLKKLRAGGHLDEAEAKQAFDTILKGEAHDAQVGALLMAIAARGPGVDELVAAAKVMRQNVVPLDVTSDAPLVDTCGTGGDVKGTFNISTAAAIVAAAAGATVVKHGNRAASSKSGSADVLEALGVSIECDAQTLQRCLDETRLCFAFARSFHPAMRHVAAVRKALGFPTLFNLLGPLTNPAGAKRQLLGVYDAKLATLVAEALVRLGCEHAWVCHADDGLDELSVESGTSVGEVRDGRVESTRVDPAAVGITPGPLDTLKVEDATASAAMIRRVLDAEPGPWTEIVVLNAGAVLVVAGVASDLGEGVTRCTEALAKGDAKRTLDTLARLSRNA